MLGLSNMPGGQLKKRRDKWIATDYRLRSRLGHRKVAAAVAFDWFGRDASKSKASQVSDIARRYRTLADAEIDRWEAQHPLELWLDAVADARNQLLNGGSPSVTKHSKETIEIGLDFSAALMGPPELRNE
jgi:hypothetical protein